LANIETQLVAAKSFLNQTIDQLEKTPNDFVLATECKIFCSETARTIASVVAQIFGAVGYTLEYGIERIIRDVGSLSIIGAPNDVLIDKISHNMIQEQDRCLLLTRTLPNHRKEI